MRLSAASLLALLPTLAAADNGDGSGDGLGDCPFCYRGIVLNEHNIAFIYGTTCECQRLVERLPAGTLLPGRGFPTLAAAGLAARAAARRVQAFFADEHPDGAHGWAAEDQDGSQDGGERDRVMSVAYPAVAPDPRRHPYRAR